MASVAKKRKAPDGSTLWPNEEPTAETQGKSTILGNSQKKSKLEESDTTTEHSFLDAKEVNGTKPDGADNESNVLDMDMDMDMGDSENEKFVTSAEAADANNENDDLKLMIEMGFPTAFGSTKGKHVEGNDIYVAHKVKIRKQRQIIGKKGRPRGGGRKVQAKQKPNTTS